MRSIYTQLLKSNNVVVDGLCIRDSINRSQIATLNKMEFLVRAKSETGLKENEHELLSSVYSVPKEKVSANGEFFIPAILDWKKLSSISVSKGLCRVSAGTKIVRSSDFNYNEAALIEHEQLHCLSLTVEAISENGVEWFALHNDTIVDTSSRSEQAFRLPWLAKANTNSLSPVDVSLLTIIDIISTSNGEASFQLGERILESPCPDYVVPSNQKVVVCDKGLILRSKRLPTI